MPTTDTTVKRDRPEPTLPHIEGRYWKITTNHRFGVQSLNRQDGVLCPIDGNDLWLEAGCYDDGYSEHGLHCLACGAKYDARDRGNDKVDRSAGVLKRQAIEYLGKVQRDLESAGQRVIHLEAVLKSAEGNGLNPR